MMAGRNRHSNTLQHWVIYKPPSRATVPPRSSGAAKMFVKWMSAEFHRRYACFTPALALRTLPRSVPQVTDLGTSIPAFHPSVLDRWQNPPIEQSPYWATHALALAS
jgi:hypothetical protein